MEANGTFAVNFSTILSKDSLKMYVSSMSISSALATVFMGAKGDNACKPDASQEVSLNKSSGNGGGDVHGCFQSLLCTYLLKTAKSLFKKRHDS